MDDEPLFPDEGLPWAEGIRRFCRWPGDGQALNSAALLERLEEAEC